MFKVLMICAIVGVAVASPLSRAALRGAVGSARTGPIARGDEVHAEVISREDDVRANGFKSSLETTNHISRSEEGDVHGNIKGGYGWLSPEGEDIQISYVADENGYQPQGAVLPTPPPIPVEIQRALAWIAAHPPAPEPHSLYLRTLLKWFNQYNYKNIRIWAGPLAYVVLVECKYVEHVLSSTALAYKYDPYTFLYPWLGSGLLTANGHHWATRRKLITPSFHFRILKDFLHVMNETSSRFMKLLEQESDTARGQVLDMQGLVTRNTIDVICETAMGTRVNSIEGRPSPIVGAIDSLCNIIPERAFSIFMRLDVFYKYTPSYRQQQQALTTLRVEFAQIIEQRRRLLQTSRYQAPPLDDELLDGKRPKMAFLDNLLTAEVDGKSLTFEDIFEEVSTFMFEGHDTTASAITFAIWCMAWTPAVQQRAYEEQVLVYGDERERHPTYEELQDMKYLDLVIKETLRLFPSVPFIFRTNREPTVIVDKYLPKDTTIMLPILAIGHNPHSFEAPFEFRPERFEAAERTQANAFDNVPFSAGPRNCIGQKFALLELKVTLSKLLRKFRILPAPLAKQTLADVFNHKYKPGPQELKLHLPITLKSMSGVPVRLQRR